MPGLPAEGRARPLRPPQQDGALTVAQRGARRRQRTAAGRAPTSRTSWSSPGSRGAGQVERDERLRGRGLLLRRQPAGGDDPLARRSCSCTRARRSSAPRSCATRAAASTWPALAGVIDQLAAAGVVHRVVFLTADEEALVNRYKETRRRHPLVAARQRGRRHPRRAGAARAGPPARGHRDRHVGPERRRAAPQGRRRAARARHAGQARGHVHVLRAQARPAARRRPRVRRALPAQPALRRRPAPADRLRPADRRLRRPRRPPRGVLRRTSCRCWSSCSRSTWPRARRT